MGPNIADSASPLRGSLQYLRDGLAQCDAELAKLDDKYIQREKLVTSLEVCLTDMESQYATFLSNCDVLRAANDDLLRSRGTDLERLFILRSRALELETVLQALRGPPSDLSDAVRDRDCYKVLLRSLAAQCQRLEAGYTDIVRCAHDSQASF